MKIPALLRSALILAAALLPSAALSQVQFPSAGNTAVTVPSFVMQCLDANGRAVPATAAGSCGGGGVVTAVGPTAPGSAVTSNPLINGGVVNTTSPTARSTGQAAYWWMGDRGSGATFLTNQAGSAVAPVSGTNGLYVDNRSIGGVTISVGSGVMDTGTQRTALATDSPGQIGTGTAGSPNAQVITAQGITGGAGFGSVSDYPVGGTGTAAVPVAATSGNVAAATATATLAGTSGKTTYITGLQIVGTGATAASVVSCTITGLLGGTVTLPLGVVAGATLQNPIINISYAKPVPASAANTSIVVSCPTLGSGNTNNSVSAQGYQF